MSEGKEVRKTVVMNAKSWRTLRIEAAKSGSAASRLGGDVINDWAKGKGK